MRHAVKKPSLAKNHHKPAVETKAVEPLSRVVVNKSVERIDEKRLSRAKQIRRSRLISHFPSWSPPAGRSAAEALISLPKRPAAQHADKHPSRSHHSSTTPKEAMLNQAVERATSHLQPPPPKSKRSRLKRRASMGAAVGLSVLLLGVIVVQNQDGVRLQMASAKAGFDVSLPDYRPAGYALGQIDYSQGAAAERFRGPNGSHYTITQEKSDWDSQALLKNFVVADYGSYQTVAAGGRTIFLYGGHNATWVYGGVWYIIQADGSVSNQQLIDLAASL